MDNLARHLWDARVTGFSVPRQELIEIDDVSKAYGVQARQVAYSGLNIGGWKLGATAEAALGTLGLDAPFMGSVPKSEIYETGADIALFADHTYFAETEITLQLGDRIPPRPDPYSRDELADAVASWHASIEIVGLRVEGGPKGLGSLIIADGAGHRATILGPKIDPNHVDEMEVRIRVGDAEVVGGTQNLIWDHVLDGLAYLAANQERLARRIAFDDIVMTGTMTGMTPFEPGAVITAEFGQTKISATTSEE